MATLTDRELARYVEFLKKENNILRSPDPGQVLTKPHEWDRLLKFGKPLGRVIEDLLIIVSPSTFYRWLRDASQGCERMTPVSSGRRNLKRFVNW